MAELQTQWKTLNDGSLRIEWSLGGFARVLRYAIGIPLLLAGLFFVYVVISNVGYFATGKGQDLIVGTLVSLLFCCILLPLGWWMVMSRSHIRFSPDGQSVTEVVDWRVGKKEKKRAVEDFQSINVSVEELNAGATRSDDSGSPAMGIRIAMVSEDGGKTPPFELGWFEADKDQLPQVRNFLFVVNSTTGLCVEDHLEDWFGDEAARL